jgi:hypothetical protein
MLARSKRRRPFGPIPSCFARLTALQFDNLCYHTYAENHCAKKISDICGDLD